MFTWKYISQSQITQSTSTSSASDDDDDDDNCQKKGFSNIGVDLGLGLGLGIGPVPFPGFLYFFIVSEPVSKKFGTEKSLGTGLEKIWYRKKVSEPVSFRFWVSSHTVSYIHNLIAKAFCTEDI